MKEALLYKPLEGGKVLCTACARYCKIGEGQIGLCGIRQNIDGKLHLLVYGKVIAGNIDPIEKKPVTHYMPGSKIFSIATTGCNWLCHPAGTEILLANGQPKAVEKIEPGDVVRSYDLASGITPSTSVVTHVGTRFARVWRLRFGSGETGRLLLTEEHPVLTRSGWDPASDLTPGEQILRIIPQGRHSHRVTEAYDEETGFTQTRNPAGPQDVAQLLEAPEAGIRIQDGHEWVDVLDVGPTDRIERVFSFETVPDHNYVAAGIVVHNCQYCFPGETPISTDQGPLPIQKLWDRAQTARRAGHGEVADLFGIQAWTHRGRPRPVEQVYRHFYSGDLLEIQVEGLPRLRCTPDHRLYARHHGTLRKVPAHRLRPGDLVAVPRGTSNGPSASDGRASLLEADLTGAQDVLLDIPQDRAWEETGDHQFRPVRGRHPVRYIGYVYNLAVAEDHSYVASRIAVANCQNFDISQRRKVEGIDATPRQVVDMALEHGCQGLAYTYNQPTIFMEYAHDIGVEARKEGLINIFVSNGYDTPDTVAMMDDFLDCITVDFKGNAEPKFTRRYIGVPDPQPIFDTLLEIRDKTDVHIEITDLVVPEVGDDLAYAEKLSRFVHDELGPDTPIHFLRFHPDYKMNDLPWTPVETLEKHHAVAKEVGLRYVYVGNVPGHPLEHTYCPACGAVAIERHGFDIQGWNLDEENRCKGCGHPLPIVGPLQDSWREFRFRPVMYR